MTARDTELIECLLNDDETAWTQTFTQVALAIMRRKGYALKLESNGHSPADVIHNLYILFHKDDFRLIKNIHGSFTGWLRDYVRNEVNKLVSPEKRIVLVPGTGDDDEQVENPASGIDSMVDDIENDIRRSEIGVAPSSKVEMEEAEEERTARQKLVQGVFSDFWSEDPQTAYALQMNLEMGLTYSEVGKLIGVKGNTVQQWVYRSRNWWRTALAAKNRVTK